MGEGLVVIGVDARKRTDTLLASDGVGRRLAAATGGSDDGWASGRPGVGVALAGTEWAVEDCRHLARTLESDLLRAGERVVRVPRKLMSGARRSAREAG